MGEAGALGRGSVEPFSRFDTMPSRFHTTSLLEHPFAASIPAVDQVRQPFLALAIVDAVQFEQIKGDSQAPKARRRPRAPCSCSRWFLPALSASRLRARH
jgi:hypothetical protein